MEGAGGRGQGRGQLTKGGGDMSKWNKVASVTTGGKRFFYTRYDATSYPYTIRQSIVWDRHVRAYACAVNDSTKAYRNTVNSAKYFFG